MASDAWVPGSPFTACNCPLAINIVRLQLTVQVYCLLVLSVICWPNEIRNIKHEPKTQRSKEPKSQRSKEPKTNQKTSTSTLTSLKPQVSSRKSHSPPSAATPSPPKSAHTCKHEHAYVMLMLMIMLSWSSGVTPSSRCHVVTPRVAHYYMYMYTSFES